MNLRELRYQINFQYVKNIRRYIYNIEEEITELLPTLTVQPTPQLPNDAEPTVERLVLLAEDEEKRFIVKVTQVGMVFGFIYNKVDGLDKSLFEKEADNLYIFGNKVKDKFIKMIPDFELSYEVFAVISGQIYKDYKVFSDFIEFDLGDDEVVENRTKEDESLFLITKEKAARKIFNLNPNDSFYSKNNEDNFSGYQVTELFQISSRLAYNNSKEFRQEDVQLVLEDIKRFYYDSE